MRILLSAYILDLILGDPQGYPHPIRYIGNLISFLEKKLLNLQDTDKKQFRMGVFLSITVILTSYIITFYMIKFAFILNNYLGIFVSIILGYTVLASKSLDVETKKVYRQLQDNNISEARRYLSYIVGRETKDLDEAEITRATVETIGENIADGIIAPMLYFTIGGVPLAMAYKAVNTLDSMIGYKSEKYMYFGRFAAIFDDLVNYIPARLTGIFIVIAAAFKGMDYKRAFYIMKRDKKNHESPNAGYPEAAVAGALNIQLGGTNKYFGKEIYKPTLGDALEVLESKHILLTIKLMYGTSMVGVIIFTIFKILMGDL